MQVNEIVDEAKDIIQNQEVGEQLVDGLHKVADALHIGKKTQRPKRVVSNKPKMSVGPKDPSVDIVKEHFDDEFQNELKK